MIGVFVNPPAGKGNALRIAAVIEKMLFAKEIPFIIYKENWPDELKNSNEAWIVGGDGTMNYFLNRYRDIEIPMAIFKGGTGNDFAWKLYGNMSAEKQIEHVLNVQPQKTDAALCNNFIFINSVGIGFDGEVLKSMSAIRWIGGHVGYLLVVIKKIFGFREFTFTISSDEINTEEKYLLANIANSSRTGGGFMISPLAQLNDGKLNLMLCKKLSVLKRLRYLPVIEKGKHLQLPFITHLLTEKISVETNIESYAQLDGELIHSKKYDIHALPGKYLFRY